MEAVADQLPMAFLVKTYSLPFVLILQEVLEVFSVFLNLIFLIFFFFLGVTMLQKQLTNSLKRLYHPYPINLVFHQIHFVW